MPADSNHVIMPLEDFRLAIEAQVRANSCDSLLSAHEKIGRLLSHNLSDREKQLGAQQRIIDQLNLQLTDCGAPWYDHFWLGAVVTTIAVGGIILLVH